MKTAVKSGNQTVQTMTESARELVRRGAQLMVQSGISGSSAAFESRRLFEHFCKITKTDMVLNPSVTPNPESAAQFICACQRRASGEPLQYIIGSWEFMGLEFEVNPSVLIPRADTETLVTYTLEKYGDCEKSGLRILDICCGSGCIGLALKHFLPQSSIVLADISENALIVAQKNSRRLGLDTEIVKCDLLSGYKSRFQDGEFDIIVSNPPYIKSTDMNFLQREVKHEPRIALDGGEDGMKFYRALALLWEGALKPHGEMILEAGYDTSRGIYSLFAECGYSEITTRRDLGGIVRLVAAKRGSGYENN